PACLWPLGNSPCWLVVAPAPQRQCEKAGIVCNAALRDRDASPPQMPPKSRDCLRSPIGVSIGHPAKRPSEEAAMAAVKPIPDGYPRLTPYLIVGAAAAAIAFYEKAFGARLRLKLDEPGGKIGHAELEIGDSLIMLADEH